MGNWLSKRSREKVTEPPRNDTPSSSGQTSSQTRGFDDVIIKVGDAISDDGDLRRLGLELGVKIPDINRALETNWAGGRKTSNGNAMMLQNWAKMVKPSKRLPTLRAALKRAGLLEVEETCFTSSCSDDDEAMPSDIMKLREQLKRRYLEKFGQIKTSPVDSKSRTWRQHIYVSLVLMLGSGGEREKQIDYDGLFKFIKIDTPKGFVTRLAFIGEAGVGKSTLFAKIALDWAFGKILQEINLLFLESFREITESEFFGDTVMDHFPDDSEIKGERVDEYIRKNQKKVLILLDGLDEAQIDIKKPNRKDAIVSIVRGERLIDTTVVITTRPSGADQIKNITEINDHYTFGKVKGFTKSNVAEYIKNFFKDDSDSASSLIEFINTNHVISEYMAPFPIFCCMLCSLWKTPSGREHFQPMETYSQLLECLVFSLQEQYSSKHNEFEGGYENGMKKAVESMKEIGCVAFQGLLNNRLIFDEMALDSSTEAAMIACEVGILSKEIRPASLEIRESQGKQFIRGFSFPHKLLQEYIASFYLASLFHEDRQEFNRILADTLLGDYTEFRYVLYFTAAHGGEVGKSVLEALCKEVDDMEFIIEVAFECHDAEAIDPVRNLLKAKADLLFIQIAAYLFTLETIGKEVVRRSPSIRETLGGSESFGANPSSSHVAAAVGLFTLQNLRSFTIISQHPDDEFYTGMSAAASQSKIKELTHKYDALDPTASSHYARGLCSMPNLRSLKLDCVGLSDEFYSTMASESSKSKIQALSILSVLMTPRRLHSILSLPRLQSLTLRDIEQVDMDDGESLASHITSVDELSVDGKHVTSLWNLGLHTSCPRVQKLTLSWQSCEHVSSDVVTMACSPFHRLTHLYIQGYSVDTTTLNDPVSFCDAVKTSCPRLTKLNLTCIELNNMEAAEIVQLMKTHPHLTSIELTCCDTNADLDPLISEVNSEGKLTVTVTHGVFNIKLFIEKAAKISQLMETHPHPTSIDQTSRKRHGFDDVITKVANAVSDDGDIRRLGLELGVQTPDINRALETNWAGGTKTSNGYVMILQNWAETVKPSKQLPILRAALQAAGLTEIEETCLPKKSKYHDEGIFDQTGGKLHVPAYGVTLCIPPGALQQGSSETITLDVLTDIPPEITLRHYETSVTYGFKCLPSGLQFESEKPVTLKIPHCANLIDPTNVQVVLYIWNYEGEADRIVQTSRTCRVTCNHVEVLLEHFTIGLLAFADLFSVGSKRMSFMPFLPKIMPECGISIPLQFHMVNKPHGNSWRDVHEIREEDEYQPVKDKDDEMNVKRKDMEVTCQLNDNDTCRKNVAVCYVRKPRHIVYFKLDWEAENVLVQMEVIQSGRPMEIMFRTRYLASRITEAPISSASTSVAIPPQGASAGADEVSTSHTSDDVSDGQLNTLAAHIPPGKYNDLSVGLGIEYDGASVILKKHGSDSKLAMRECLSVWKNKSGGSFTELNRIFDNVELGGLWTKHMNKT